MVRLEQTDFQIDNKWSLCLERGILLYSIPFQCNSNSASLGLHHSFRNCVVLNARGNLIV